jgi:hypothetical protein
MKKLLSALALAAGVHAASAQNSIKDGEWFHAVGYDYTIGIDLSTPAMPFASNGVTWAPRYTFPVGDEMSFGVVAPVGLGLAQSPFGGINLGYHCTLAATMQVGLASTQASNAFIGAFVNLGYGSYARQVRNTDGIGPAFVRDGSTGVFSEVGVRYDYMGNEVNLSAGLWRVPASADRKADVVSLRLLYGFGKPATRNQQLVTSF